MNFLKYAANFVIAANLISCGLLEQDHSNLNANVSEHKNQRELLAENGIKLDITALGASISQGVGASFPLQTRLVDHLQSDYDNYSKLFSVYGDKKIGIIFDYFFITNFPYWSPTYNGSRIDLVREHLQDISGKYDFVFYSKLPNENMLYKNSAMTRGEWDKRLNHKELESIRNILGNHPFARVASVNPFPKRVRDQINSQIDLFVKDQPNKFIEMPVDKFLQHVVEHRGVKYNGKKISVPQIFSDDKLHLNDSGQAALINRVILKSIYQHANMGQSFISTDLNELPSAHTEQWKKDLEKRYFNTNEQFLAGSDGDYLLKFKSKDAFIGSMQFVEGNVPEKNYRLAKQRFKDLFPHVIRGLADHLDLSIPVRINQGIIKIDMRKAMQASELTAIRNADGKIKGASRDFWLSMGLMTTNNLYEIDHIGSNNYEFKLTLLPLFNFQKPGLFRTGDIPEEDKKEILNRSEDYHRVVLSGTVVID